MDLTAGSTAQVNVSAEAFNGFTGPVSATVSGLPSGVTASPAILTLTPGTPQTITLTAVSNAAAGSTSLTLQGTSGSLSHNLAIPLAVVGATPLPAPDFSLQATPSTLTLVQGGAGAQVTVIATAMNGFTGSIAVNLGSLPNGVLASPSSFMLTPGVPQQVSFIAESSAAGGTATAAFAATSGTIAHTASVGLTIATPDFSLQVSPTTLTLEAGMSAQTASFNATALNGFSGLVTILLSGEPADVTVSPASFYLTPGIPQTISVSAGSNAASETGTLNITAISGALTHTATIGLTVAAPTPDFTLSVGPGSINLTPAAAGQVTPSQPLTLVANPVGGFNEPINLNFSGLPSNVTISQNPAPLAPGIPQQLVLMTTSAPQSNEVATVTVTAVSPSITHTAQFTLSVSATPTADFGFYTNPYALLLSPGQSTVSIAPDGFNGFSSGINLQISGLPPGVTADFTSEEVPPNTPMTLTLTVPPGTPPSSGLIALDGTADSQTHETDIPYAVVSGPQLLQFLGPTTLTLNQGETSNLILGAESTIPGAESTLPSPITTTLSSALPAASGLTSPFFGSLFNPTGYPSYIPVTATAQAPVGQSTLTFTTSDGTVNLVSQVTVNVVSGPYFTLQTTPAVLNPLTSAPYPISVEAVPIDGFSNPVTVTLTTTGGVSVSPATFTLTPGTPQTFSMTAIAGGQLQITAVSGSIVQNVSLPVIFGLPAPFTVTNPESIINLSTDTGLQPFAVTENSASAGYGLLSAVISGIPTGVLIGQSENEINPVLEASSSLNLSANCGDYLPNSLQCGEESYWEMSYDGAAAVPILLR